MIVGYYKNYLYTTDKVSSEKKNNNEESQYMVSHPETGSDSPIRSDQYRGRDTQSLYYETSASMDNLASYAQAGDNGNVNP